MNYYELIYLKDFLKHKLIDAQIVLSTTRFKNLIEFYVESEQERWKLVFSTAPGNIALFLDAHSEPKQKNRLTFFEDIYEHKVLDIVVAETDRILKIVIENDYELVFKLFSNQANVFLVKQGSIVEAFKGNVTELPVSKSITLFNEPSADLSTKEKITSINPLLPRTHLTEITKEHQLDTMSNSRLTQQIEIITKSVQEEPEFRLLENGNTTLFNPSILSISTARNFESVNDLIAYRFKTYSHTQRLRQKKGDLLKQLKRQIKRTASGLKNLSLADKGISRSEEYEKCAHLLMANAHLGKPEGNKIVVDDLYDAGNKIEIRLDANLNIAENAQRYYDKARNSAISYEEAIKRVPILEARKEKLETFVAELQEIQKYYKLQEWEKVHKEQLIELGVGTKEGNTESGHPFHVFEVQGFIVWIGKNARNNDILVQMAHKEDIWLHARGVSGSHVIIRMGNNKKFPPKAVIQEAASYAAFNSKARGAELVPVIFTKKKYVRKVKKAAPGAVIVEREEVEFVVPKSPSNE